MKYLWIAIVFAGLILSSCCSQRKENAKLSEDIAIPRAKLLQSDRNKYEKHEYPKLNAFAKQGYDWFWSKSMLESSHFGTDRERERILKEHGASHGEHWVKGWYIAYSMWSKSCGRDPSPLERIFSQQEN